jgi:hypothetical protein
MQPATDEVIRQAVQKWHEAILSRNPELLNDIYAARVDFYGQRRSRDQVVSDKLSALKRAPDYVQSLSKVRITWIPKDEPVASFEKRWSGAGKSRTVNAWLRLVRERSEWRVATESDGPTDELKVRAHSLSKSCETAVIQLVLDTEEARARRMTQGPSKTREFNGVSVEGVNWPILDVNVHEVDESGMRNSVAWFAVDVEHATVAERNLSSFKPGALLATSPERQRVVLNQCRKPGTSR